MGNLFTLNFWFNYHAIDMLPVSKIVFLVFVVLLFSAAIIFFFLRKRNAFYRRWYGFSSTNTVIGVFFGFLNYQLVPFWSARIWLLLWSLCMILWVVSIFRRYQHGLKRRAELRLGSENKKYYPKSKKHKNK